MKCHGSRRGPRVRASIHPCSWTMVSTGKAISGLSRFVLAIILCLGVLATCLRADSTTVNLKSKTLEELANIEVTSVSKKAEPLSEAAAAVYVITADDIKKMGATTIAEALRMAPGVQVSRIDASTWAITSRGFSGSFANKLLVLVDGRSAYTPLFSGVYWDVQDVLLEDIDRIEVVRGPGGTLWGANAVNGVINIITKSSGKTQGILVNAGTGTEERANGAVQYGGKLNNGITYRAYGKYALRNNSTLTTNLPANDAWDVLRGGFRMDWKRSDDNSFTLQGDIYSGKLDRTYTFPLLADPWTQTIYDTTTISGGNALGQWIHQFSSSSEMTIQAYFDGTERADRYASEQRNTFDMDIQHSQKISSRLDFLWGVGYRVSQDDIDSTSQSYAVPPKRTDNLYSAFAQMNIWFVPDRLRLSIGSKLEHNDYTGAAYQPGVRLLWLPSEHQSLWAAVSRAVRTPSRVEYDARIFFSVLPPMTPENPGPVPALLTLTGDHQFKSEELLAYELGYRIQASEDVSLDLSLFNNDFDRIRSLEAGEPIPNALPPTYVTIPVTPHNNTYGRTYGLELAADWQANSLLTFKASYSYLRVVLHSGIDDLETEMLDYEKASPRNQVALRSTIGPVRNLELGAGLRYVDPLPAFDIPSYVGLDIRLGWTPSRNLELSLVGQNLLKRYHLEYEPELSGIPTYIARGVYSTIAWRF